MPNWCATNYAVKGTTEELKGLETLLNSIKNRPEPTKNGFGPLWLGKLVDALGTDWKTVPCRGCYDPNPEACACLCGPDPDENETVEVENGMLRFSFITAYCRSEKLEELFKKKFPSLEFLYSTTDEFSNFAVVHDPKDEACFYRYYLNDGHESFYYEKTERDEFIRDLIGATPGLGIKEDITDRELNSHEFIDRFVKWREGEHIEASGDTDFDFVDYVVYTEEN